MHTTSKALHELLQVTHLVSQHQLSRHPLEMRRPCDRVEVTRPALLLGRRHRERERHCAHHACRAPGDALHDCVVAALDRKWRRGKAGGELKAEHVPLHHLILLLQLEHLELEHRSLLPLGRQLLLELSVCASELDELIIGTLECDTSPDVGRLTERPPLHVAHPSYLAGSF